MKIHSRFMTLAMLGCVLALSACKENGGYAIGDTGPSGVGIVFYLTDGGLHGLETAPVDQSIGTEWSTITNAFANGSSALPAEIGTGSANTDVIITQNGGNASAAKLGRDYSGGSKTDWFLPSYNELQAIWDNLVKEDDGAGGWQNSGVGGFAATNYWSSSEQDETSARLVDFVTGNPNVWSKPSIGRVRAVRVF